MADCPELLVQAEEPIGSAEALQILTEFASSASALDGVTRVTLDEAMSVLAANDEPELSISEESVQL